MHDHEKKEHHGKHHRKHGGRARHHKHHKAHGGEVYYSGGSSNVATEAAEKKRGGKVHRGKHVEMPEHKKPKHRMDKKPRKAHGGRVGSDKAPFSSAARPAQNTEAAKP